MGHSCLAASGLNNPFSGTCHAMCQLPNTVQNASLHMDVPAVQTPTQSNGASRNSINAEQTDAVALQNLGNPFVVLRRSARWRELDIAGLLGLRDCDLLGLRYRLGRLRNHYGQHTVLGVGRHCVGINVEWQCHRATE